MTPTAVARTLRDALIAGLCGTVAQLALRAARKALGVLPDFQPYDDMQRELLHGVGTSLPSALQALLPLISGALIWSSIFAWAYRWIPGRTALRKGLAVSGFAWLLTGLVLFPAIGKGVFARDAGQGGWPALMMLVMLSSYCITLSLVYGWLRRDRQPEDLTS
ncbi:MAG: hypothetical protein HXX15_17310 [Rhodopseudomonas sp.]|uniref:DUF6789 family protein n=1 Tax=Rhodopseudomonas sp. TaxID=1078 RepID=UPI00178D0ACC|nr:DUF6789 family protein [Rhodopseudomonas sp.]NVN87838.1 hypothetical protein [Rhodopseudomonas sp.]